MSKDTIYAPASSTQKSGVMIVRVSGSKVEETIISLVCHPLEPRHATFTDVVHPLTKQLIDKAIAIFYKAPHSFTGEDILELHIHGSKAVLKLTLDALANMHGLRFAEPGEFSLRSFLNGKMDLTQVEGLADLIDAETEAQHAQSLKQMSGSLKDIYELWRKQLINIISKLEAAIDFPDDDIPESVTYDLEAKVRNLCLEIENHLSDDRKGEKLREGMYIAILGPTNAGKSSLINRIANRDVAIVSQIAGTTRDVIEVHLNIKGYPVIVADTAGIRESSDVLENVGIKKSLERAQTADLKIIVLDASMGTRIDSQLLEMIDKKTIVVFNKVDICNDSASSRSDGIWKISAKENTGIDKLMDEIARFANVFFGTASSNPLITRQRYRDHLINTRQSLLEFNLNKDLVLAAEDLRSAANYLGKIVGKIDVESILGEIFSSFCIGK